MSATPEALLQRPLDSESATLALGAALARSLPRDAHEALVVYLQGDLGSGKTTLARALLRELGAQGTVRSPSYTLVESYELSGLLALHLDLYRLRDASELEHLAIRDQLRAGVLLLVEWPERAPGLLPAPDLGVELVVSTTRSSAQPVAGPPTGVGDTVQLMREVRLSAASAAGQRWLAALDPGHTSRINQS